MPSDPAVVHLAQEIRDLVWRGARRLRDDSAAAGGLSLGQRSVLAALLTEPGITSSELARIERVRPQSMSTTVAALRDVGLVEARADARDGRRVALSVTAAGREALDAARAERDDWLAQRIEHRLQDPEQRARLHTGVEALRSLLEDD